MTDLFQPVSKNIFYRLQSWHEKSDLFKILRAIDESQFWPPNKIRELQFERLKKLLVHAYRNCPFYTEQFNRLGFDPSCFNDLSELEKLPIVTKKDIQQNRESMKAGNFPTADLMANKTGGSTGSPLHFYHDRARLSSRKAFTFRHDKWTGWDLGYKTAALWGHRQDVSGHDSLGDRIRNALIYRSLVLDTSSLSKEKFAEFTDRLKKYNPLIYVAYANSIYLFARYLKETNRRDFHRPQAIITSAEVLTGEQRKVIESVFECRVFDRYGSRETSVIATECEKHNGLHIAAESLFLEFTKSSKAVKPGELGKIIVTDLLNYGMPFIRYQIEDIGVPSDEICSCGRGLPLMKMAAGRVTDFLVTPERKIISGASLTIYLIVNAPGVAQAQLIQESIDHIHFKIVKGEKFSEESLKFFEREIPKFFGNSMKYSLEFVDQIPTESSGKYRFSISQIDPAEGF